MPTSAPTLKEYLNELENLIKKTQLALKDAPEGGLHIKTNRGAPQFFHRQYNCRDIYIPQDRIAFVRRLAQKRYDRMVLELLRALYADAKDICRHFPAECVGELDASFLYSAFYQDLDEIYISQGAIRQDLIIPVIPTTKQFVEAWLAEPYDRLPFRDTDQSRYFSKGHGRVRSKTELYIADRLFYGKYPTKYECPLYLENITLHPDFTVMDTHTRRVKYIEHCGMMGDAAYVDSLIRKINTYESNGIFPGEGLLLTYESATRPFDTRTFDRLLQHHFREPLSW